jgi:hypothetical protein
VAPASLISQIYGKPAIPHSSAICDLKDVVKRG